MLRVFVEVDDNPKIHSDERSVQEAADRIMQKFSEDGVFTQDNFLLWSMQTKTHEKFTRLLAQICHVVLGSRPQEKAEEFSSIIEWLQRDERRQKVVGDVYYVISNDWWRSWNR